MAQWTRAVLEREAAVAAAVEEALAEAGGGGITDYDTWAELPAAPEDGTQALLCGHLVEYTEGTGWAYVKAPSTPTYYGSLSPLAIVGPVGSYGAEPSTRSGTAWDTAPWTLVT